MLADAARGMVEEGEMGNEVSISVAVFTLCSATSACLCIRPFSIHRVHKCITVIAACYLWAEMSW